MLGWIDYFTNIFSGKYINARNYYFYGKIKQSKLKLNYMRSKSNMIKNIKI